MNRKRINVAGLDADTVDKLRIQEPDAEFYVEHRATAALHGPKMTWNADGQHTEDPRLADQPERVGGLKGCWTISWDDIREKHARLAP